MERDVRGERRVAIRRLLASCEGWVLLGVLAIGMLACRATSTGVRIDIVRERASHRTELIVKGPSPQPAAPLTDDGDIRAVTYQSAGRTLRGLLALPPGAKATEATNLPALLYLHGGFALGIGDVEDVAAFTRAGYVVFAPAYRGENGNPGNHELFYGELDDARAALDYLLKQRFVDQRRTVVFGHSAGGILASLLSLYDDLPVALTGSAGGLYDVSVFDSMKLPFEDTPKERALRVLYPNVEHLRKRHFACVGQNDALPFRVAGQARELAQAARTPLEVVIVPGNHFTSLPACVSAFLAAAAGTPAVQSQQ